MEKGTHTKERGIPLSVFFPAYNEEANIRDSVSRAEAELKKLTDQYEIIIVNDGSKDATGLIADELARNNHRVRVVHHCPNKGYGAAVWSGIQAARYKYVFFTDADLQFDLAEIRKLTKHVPEYRVVLGYRAKRMDPFIRLVNAKGWNVLNRLFFGLKAKDIDCAFKLFERDLVADLPIQSRGAMMSAEMLIRLQRLGVAWKEVPVTHLPRKAGEATGAKPAVILRAFKEMLSLYSDELGNPAYKQAFRYGVVGLANTFLDLAVYVLLTRLFPFFGSRIVLAKILSFFTGSVSSLMVNRRWTFELKHKLTLNEVLKFYSTIGVSILLNAVSMYVFTSVMGVPDIAAAAFSTVVTFAWSFVASKLWVFTKSPVTDRKWVRMIMNP